MTRRERVGRERVATVKLLVLNGLGGAVSLPQLAQCVGCSTAHLSRTFRRLEGVTLIEWIRSRRLDRAAELLASRQCNVTEAAAAVGYRRSHFIRAFFEEKGVPPSQWRSLV